jgi:hypothetical protein
VRVGSGQGQGPEIDARLSSVARGVKQEMEQLCPCCYLGAACREGLVDIQGAWCSLAGLVGGLGFELPGVPDLELACSCEASLALSLIGSVDTN